jgi:hypothetical protein
MTEPCASGIVHLDPRRVTRPPLDDKPAMLGSLARFQNYSPMDQINTGNVHRSDSCPQPWLRRSCLPFSISCSAACSTRWRAYMFSDKFKVAGFKGQQMTIREWDHQLRQPILLMGARSLVSMSPQDGFLHEKYPADTLGFDAPETKCRFPTAQNPQ